MKYAVFQTGGKQYKVAEGEVVDVEKLNAEPGGSFVFENILLVVNDDSIVVGQPTVSGATITAKVVVQKKGHKIRVAKFKAKSRYRRVMGHRQLLTQVQIEKINTKGESKAAPAVKAEEKKEQVKKSPTKEHLKSEEKKEK